MGHMRHQNNQNCRNTKLNQNHALNTVATYGGLVFRVWWITVQKLSTIESHNTCCLITVTPILYSPYYLWFSQTWSHIPEYILSQPKTP